MESRLRVFLLTTVLVFPGLSVHAAEKTDQPVSVDGNPEKEVIQQDPVIQPDVKRREVKQADVETENFEVGAFVGILSIEDFGTQPVIGASIDYHITEDFFLQGRIRPGYAHEIPKGGNDDIFSLGSFNECVNVSLRCYADRTTGAGKK